jgi:hypothetical protein
MTKTKYVKFRTIYNQYAVDDQPDSSGDFVLLFSELQTHAEVARWMHRTHVPISAGFVDADGDAYGSSESLNLDSDPEKDSFLTRWALKGVL